MHQDTQNLFFVKAMFGYNISNATILYLLIYSKVIFFSFSESLIAGVDPFLKDHCHILSIDELRFTTLNSGYYIVNEALSNEEGM